MVALVGKPTEPKVRIQLDLTEKQAAMFDALITECGLSSRKELFNNAVSLFNLAAVEARKGRQTAFYDEENDVVRKVMIPALEPLLADALERLKNVEKPEKAPLKVVSDERTVAPAI